MEHDHKQQSPYNGFLVQCFFLVIVPAICFLIIYSVFESFKPNSHHQHNLLASQIFASLIGVLFTTSCAIAGAFKGAFKVVKDRVKEFFENVTLSFSFAVKNYFADMKQNGIVFLVYSLIFAGEIYLFLQGLYLYMDLFWL